MSFRKFLVTCFSVAILGSGALWAADAPKMTPDKSPIAANKADIEFTSLINGDNHMDVVITSGSGPTPGCLAGQYWDIGTGGCTAAVGLRAVPLQRACNCTCPESGSCTSAQRGSYTVFGWRLPPSGRELVSHNGATTWGACQMVTNSCAAASPPPPTPGTRFIVEAFICNSGHPQYASGPLGNSERNTIITSYRQFNYGQRCPELAGYVYWQQSWSELARDWISKNPGSNMQEAIDGSKVQTIQRMNEAATQNGERLESYQTTLNAMCSSYARSKYGVQVTATYLKDSGSSCIIN